MDNIWLTPQGYQRTSKHLQKRCLELLLSFAPPKGTLLDVGCGTGNTLLFTDPDNIEHYTGIDISRDMVAYASLAHAAPNVRFMVSDFLECSLEPARYDAAICAACLHWFIPREQAVIDKLSGLIKPGGLLFLSCAFEFDYVPGERAIHEQVLTEIRQRYPSIGEPVVFDDFRFNRDSIINALRDFTIIRSHRLEEQVQFESFEDFKDWHLGSGSVVYGQFEASIRDLAINDYYQRLYEHYCAGRYHTAYSTVLLLLEKRSA
ncbi:class I SAM-dependent methyltransferase [Pseudomonas helleri]|uniref:class I SAM-dependent methyltransferase n=1 Tax=Pseudomonas helleri TaxID=1608996 RepID=UPI0030DD88DE